MIEKRVASQIVSLTQMPFLNITSRVAPTFSATRWLAAFETANMLEESVG